MSERLHRQRLETEVIVVGYAMSRLDSDYITSRGLTSWRQCFAEAGRAMAKPPATFKNLRDEFDPVHGNARKGWRLRPLRQNRQRIIDELCDLSPEALTQLVSRVLSRDTEVITEAIDSLAVQTRVAYNVAQRLLTGRAAEDYFMGNSKPLVNLERNALLDLRLQARGFDFGVVRQPEVAIEVKGLRNDRGDILFTDLEWSEAGRRRDLYWLVVVGNLDSTPRATVIRDPHSRLQAACRYQSSIAAVWRSHVSV